MGNLATTLADIVTHPPSLHTFSVLSVLAHFMSGDLIRAGDPPVF